RLVLKESGVAVLEVPYVKDLLDRCEFDTIYHEHLCYFSLTALDALFRRHGLLIHDVRHVPIHGGSLRLYASPLAHARPRTPAVASLLREERQWGADRVDCYLALADRVRALRQSLRGLLGQLKDEGRRMAAYGA